MKRPRIDKENLGEFMTRAVLLIIAVLFLGTALAGGIFYLWADKQQTQQDQTQTSKLAGKPLSGFTPVKDVKELQKIDQKIGEGKVVKADSKVTILYTGAVASNGIIFQSSSDTGQPLSDYPVSGFIKGWQQGLLGMKEGGQRRLLIPSDLAYGANPPQGSGITPNADLVFDITLLSVK